MADKLPPSPENQIEVEPTKSLFIEMLTRDLSIERAMLDLIDNCIDGAKRLRPGDDSSFDGLWVRISLNADEFKIEDNCGGFDIDTARRYAFRFGRPKEVPQTPHSIGQFGIGMKRALFKFGRWFDVVSTTRSERFRVEVDVDKWEADDSWHFAFANVERNLDVEEGATGTVISVKQLRQSVSEEFKLEIKKTTWGDAIEAAQQEFLRRGLSITFDTQVLKATPWSLLLGSGIVPARVDETIQADEKEPIRLQIFVGVAESNPQEAGWYVLCNGRMVLEADQTPVTGWTYAAESKDFVVPKYHNQFARFRGYAFFDCVNASKLPWNTTKTGVDQDSPIYRYAFNQMIAAMRPVITFLNDLDAELDDPPEDRPLNTALKVTSAVQLRELRPTKVFVRPSKVGRTGPPTVKIQYLKERDRIEELKSALNASSAKDVGEKSFELAYHRYITAKGEQTDE